jgi:NAD(P)-dependent dehydrogenase (short-subunit alcohol dehydrogenase family)
MRDAVATTLAEKPRRWFVTGGAGFIGSHVVDLLVLAGHTVTVYDNLSLSTDQHIADDAGEDHVHRKDLLDPQGGDRSDGGPRHREILRQRGGLVYDHARSDRMSNFRGWKGDVPVVRPSTGTAIQALIPRGSALL